MAQCGVFRDMGLNRILLGVHSSFSSLPLPSVYGSIFGMMSIMSALYHGKGASLEVPLACALMEALVHNSMDVALTERYLSMRQAAVKTQSYPVSQSELTQLVDPFFCQYMCSDSRHIYVVCPGHANHQERLLDALNLDPQRLGIQPVSVYTSSEQGIGSMNQSPKHARILRDALTLRFVTQSSTTWHTLLTSVGVPVSVVRTFDEWKMSPHSHDSGLIRQTSEGVFTPGPLVWTSSAVPCDESNGCPEPPAAADEGSCRGPLHGIRVADMTNVIAGPTCGCMLGRLGATVIKIDPVVPAYAPDVTVVYGVHANENKKSVLLDAFEPTDRTALEHIVRSCDVLLLNRTADSAARLRLNDDQVRRINPNIVILRFDAWSGPHARGPLMDVVGYDDTVQAGTGIMARFGGGLDTAEEHAHVGTLDVVSGVAAAAAVVFGLYRRKVFKEATTVKTSLAAVSNFVQYMFFVHPERDVVWTPCQTRRVCRGTGPLNACYDTTDGSVIISTRRCADARLEMHVCNTLGVSCVDMIVVAVSLMTTAEVIRLLHDPPVVFAARLSSFSELRKAYSSYTSSPGTFHFSTYDRHSIGSSVCMFSPVAVRCSVPGWYRTYLEAPHYGQHTQEIMEALLRNGKPWNRRRRWSDTYLP